MTTKADSQYEHLSQPSRCSTIVSTQNTSLDIKQQPEMTSNKTHATSGALEADNYSKSWENLPPDLQSVVPSDEEYSYSGAQPQVYKRVRVTRITRNITRECQRACERAHASDAFPTRESKLASVKLENTREYSQTNTRVLAIVLAITRNRTREYSQSNSRVVEYSQSNLRVFAIEFASTCNHSRG